MSEESDELDQELERGEQAQKALAEHLHNMGAAKCENIVEYDGRSYRVTIESLPHPSDFTENEQH